MRISQLICSLFILTLAVFVLSSCGNDEGCTDPSSANFDPDALEDDGSCTSYARTSFFGDYLGNFDCADPLLSTRLDNDSLMFNVKEPVSNADVQAIILGLNIDGIPVDLEGTINDVGTRLTIDDMLENISIPDLIVPGITTVVNVTGAGFADLSMDEITLTGELELTLSSTDGSLTIMDVCTLVGTKQ